MYTLPIKKKKKKTSYVYLSLHCPQLVFILTAPFFFTMLYQVSNNGWAEGECKGKAGWFPFGYVERRERVLASKVAEVF